MKRQLLLIVMILATGTIFAQTKPEGTVKMSAAAPAPPIVPSPKQYFVVLPSENWEYLFSIIRSSGKLTAVQAEDYIEALNKEIKEVPVPAADTAKKK